MGKYFHLTCKIEQRRHQAKKKKRGGSSTGNFFENRSAPCVLLFILQLFITYDSYSGWNVPKFWEH